MDGKLIQSEMKPAPGNFTARVGVWVIAVFVVCSAFILCNYLLVNQRISAMEGKLESLQRSEKPNPNTSFGDQTGTKQVLHAREKRSVKQKTQVSTIADFEKRLQALEKRYCFFFLRKKCLQFSIDSNLVLADINLYFYQREFPPIKFITMRNIWLNN